MFTAAQFDTRRRQQPFVPIRIVMSSGQTYDIYHPELMMVGNRSIIVAAGSRKDPTRYDRYWELAYLTHGLGGRFARGHHDRH